MVDVRVMADKSYSAGYMKDALSYLRIAHEMDPEDYEVMLKLGFTENMLHDDESAVVWFGLARKSRIHRSPSRLGGRSPVCGRTFQDTDDGVAVSFLFDAMERQLRLRAD